ncbi:pseudouridine synthase [Litorimonas sp. RW-G-Af-16]|uniref:pseudouridine synthase n=1 Tax=Litorimonas sp. RW-G-Af-16 TaxID=3241168 RepID=UPI00390C5485
MENKMPTDGERIAKVLARAGVASRRDSEKLIEEGRIKVNGRVLTTPAVKVTAKDKILFDNAPIAAKEPPRLWRYHKTDGLVTSHKDEKGRSTVFDTLPKSLGRVISIGRLDMTSEGLLLLTNDGELARALEHPSTGFSRRYRARAYGRVTQEQLDTLMEGIFIDGIKTGPIEATLESTKGDNHWIGVTIREGKNREIRRAMETLDLRVNRLIRISFGPFMLGALEKGGIEEVKHKELSTKLGHLIDIPDEVVKPVKAPKRGSHASAKRFQKDTDSKPSKPAPKGRGKFAKSPPKEGKFKPRTHAKKDGDSGGRPARGKPTGKSAGRPAGKSGGAKPRGGKPGGPKR